MRSTLTFPLLAVITAALPAQWAQISPINMPTLRRAGAMAFDPINNRLLIYGGVSQTPSVILDETWSYNGQWTLLPAQAPARWGHRMVLNTLNNRLLAFGGRSPSISGLSNDTIQWTGSSWIAVPTPTAPSPRFLYGMSFDSARSVMVLFGGRDSLTALDETWEFNGISWTQVSTATSPSPREEMAMAFDPGLNRTLLFGGCNEATGEVFGDTWYYDGTDWLATTPSVSPSPRFRTATVFDSVRQRIVLFGGFDGSQIVTDTYEYSGDQWQQIATGVPVPANATEAYAGYDPVRGKFVVFGGFGGTFSNATWEYTGVNSGLFSTFGAGCATITGVPGISGSTPTIGVPQDLTFDNLPLTAQTVLIAIGLSNQMWQGLPLPFDLGLVGLPGCNLLVAADLLELTVATGGTANFSLPIPNQPSLLNQSIYFQGLVLDVVPFNFRGTTPGARAVLGN